MKHHDAIQRPQKDLGRAGLGSRRPNNRERRLARKLANEDTGAHLSYETLRSAYELAGDSEAHGEIHGVVNGVAFMIPAKNPHLLNEETP